MDKNTDSTNMTDVSRRDFPAGSVACRGRGLILPAPSGGGKTTLVAGLVAAGFDYLSDEVAKNGRGSKGEREQHVAGHQLHAGLNEDRAAIGPETNPCISRNTTSIGSEEARPQSAEHRPNPAMANR